MPLQSQASLREELLQLVERETDLMKFRRDLNENSLTIVNVDEVNAFFKAPAGSTGRPKTYWQVSKWMAECLTKEIDRQLAETWEERRILEAKLAMELTDDK